jgi:two-component system sensor histidine kinase UhpB
VKKASARGKAAKSERSGKSPAVPWRVIYLLLAAFAAFSVVVGIYLNVPAGCGLLLMVALAAYYVHRIARQMERDAAERELYVTRLRYAEARTRQILDTAGDGILTVDELGTIKSFNRAAVRIFGYRADEVIGRSVTTLFSTAGQAGHLDPAVGTGEAKVIGATGEVEGRRRDGSTFPVEPAVSKVREGSQRRVTYVVRDLTERRRAEESLRRAHDELEHRVQERTAQLAAVNQELRAEIGERKRAEQTLQQRARELAEAQRRLSTLSSQLLATQEAERRHLARELHDEIGQTLTALKLNLQAAQALAGPEGLAPLEESLGIVDRTIEQVRNLSLDLRPAMLDDLGLAAALRWYVNRQAKRADYVAELDLDDALPRLPPAQETMCFRVVQEALTNVARHAQASQVWIAIRGAGDKIGLSVRDDGVGFDVAAARQRAVHGASLGLLGIEERVRLVGGSLEIRSAAGKGAEIRVEFPLTAPAVLAAE